MKRQAWVSFTLAGVSITEFGMIVPSPFCTLELSNSEITSVTSWTLTCIVGGDDTRRVNASAFEALLYSAAQAASRYKNASGIPVSFAFGWCGTNGQIEEHVSYQGFTIQFKVSTSGRYLTYVVTGYASLVTSLTAPVLNVPSVTGWVQPSAVFIGFAKASKITNYYELDVDRNDAVTFVQHGDLNTSFINYVRGSYSGDDYDTFPGLLRLSKSYNSSREAAGVVDGLSLRSIVDHTTYQTRPAYLKKSLTDNAIQCTSFSFWIDEPTMTLRGVIHYKSDAGLLNNRASDVLEFGTAHTNVLSISGSYNGVAYNMTDMNFADVGFNLDPSGETILNNAKVVNSWSADVGDVYQTANIINDVNAIASQFSGDFSVDIPGSTRRYQIAQPVSLLVMSGNTLSPITGIYNIVSVSHKLSNSFVTTLKLQRFTMSSANQVAASQGIYAPGGKSWLHNIGNTTPNVVSPYEVNFGDIYPDFTYLWTTNLHNIA